mgnify:CR=1 FL=1
MLTRRTKVTEPAGAPSPLDRHTLTESKPSASSRSVEPVAIAAFQIRAKLAQPVRPAHGGFFPRFTGAALVALPDRRQNGANGDQDQNTP